MSAQVLPHFASHLPATQFTGLVHVTDDPLKNFRFAVKRFTRDLGAGETYASANSIERCWSYGSARLRLVVWPPSMQQWTFTNPAHDRDPRLKTACHLSIDSGFRPLVTQTEHAWLASFEPIARIETSGMSAIAQHSPARQDELEFVREPPGDTAPLFGFVGLSGDRKALVFYGSQLYLITVEDVVRFHVARALPAKGAGGARLAVICRTRCTGVESKRLTIAESKGAEDLNTLAAEVSRETGRPFELGEYEYDA